MLILIVFLAIISIYSIYISSRSLFLIKKSVLVSEQSIAELIDKNAELSEQLKKIRIDGEMLEDTADQLNSYYNLTTVVISDLFSSYQMFYEVAIKHVLGHKYAGDDPLIKNFIAEMLKYQGTMANKIAYYNEKTEEIFGKNE